MWGANLTYQNSEVIWLVSAYLTELILYPDPRFSLHGEERATLLVTPWSFLAK
jgi:hypothetical protein